MAANAPTAMEAVLAKMAARHFPLETLPVETGDPLWISMRTEYELSLAELALLKKRGRDQQSNSVAPPPPGERVAARCTLVDVDNGKHQSRVKGDFEKRELELGFIFRTVDESRWLHLMGRDFIFNPAEYKRANTHRD
jgi:hypothetical protein